MIDIRKYRNELKIKLRDDRQNQEKIIIMIINLAMGKHIHHEDVGHQQKDILQDDESLQMKENLQEDDILQVNDNRQEEHILQEKDTLQEDIILKIALAKIITIWNEKEIIKIE